MELAIFQGIHSCCNSPTPCYSNYFEQEGLDARGGSIDYLEGSFLCSCEKFSFAFKLQTTIKHFDLIHNWFTTASSKTLDKRYCVRPKHCVTHWVLASSGMSWRGTTFQIVAGLSKCIKQKDHKHEWEERKAKEDCIASKKNGAYERKKCRSTPCDPDSVHDNDFQFHNICYLSVRIWYTVSIPLEHRYWGFIMKYRMV